MCKSPPKCDVSRGSCHMLGGNIWNYHQGVRMTNYEGLMSNSMTFSFKSYSCPNHPVFFFFFAIINTPKLIWSLKLNRLELWVPGWELSVNAQFCRSLQPHGGAYMCLSQVRINPDKWWSHLLWRPLRGEQLKEQRHHRTKLRTSREVLKSSKCKSCFAKGCYWRPFGLCVSGK